MTEVYKSPDVVKTELREEIDRLKDEIKMLESMIHIYRDSLENLKNAIREIIDYE